MKKNNKTRSSGRVQKIVSTQIHSQNTVPLRSLRPGQMVWSPNPPPGSWYFMNTAGVIVEVGGSLTVIDGGTY